AVPVAVAVDAAHDDERGPFGADRADEQVLGDEPGAGKKNSGPVWAHSAFSCQASSCQVRPVMLVMVFMGSIGMTHTLPGADKHSINDLMAT
ncbi:hypothetical protein AB0R12_17285, partial [Streptomyces niveus]